MSQYETKDNSGTLFKNEKKQNANQPDYDGTVLVGGVEYRIAAWIKAANSGRKFMSLAFTPKQEPQAAPARQPARQAPRRDTPIDDMDRDVPF